MTNLAITVTNISKKSSIHFVSNIRHQHQDPVDFESNKTVIENSWKNWKKFGNNWRKCVVLHISLFNISKCTHRYSMTIIWNTRVILDFLSKIFNLKLLILLGSIPKQSIPTGNLFRLYDLERQKSYYCA